MYMLGSIPKIKDWNLFEIVTTDRYSKFTEVITTARATGMKIVNIRVDHLLKLYGIPSYLLTDNEPPFVQKLFTKLQSFLWLTTDEKSPSDQKICRVRCTAEQVWSASKIHLIASVSLRPIYATADLRVPYANVPCGRTVAFWLKYRHGTTSCTETRQTERNPER